MSKKLLNYHEELINDLQDPKETQAYLNETLIDENPAVFFLAVKNVLEAQGKNISSLAKEADLNRENALQNAFKKG